MIQIISEPNTQLLKSLAWLATPQAGRGTSGWEWCGKVVDAAPRGGALLWPPRVGEVAVSAYS